MTDTNTLLVTSTEEGIGKTAITLALATRAHDAGYDVGYMKPKGTRLRSAVGKTRDEDPMLARELLGLETDLHEMEPIVYSPTFIQEAIRGREDPDDLRERLQESIETCSDGNDLLLVEGSSDLATGSIVDLTDVDIAELLDARVLLVTGYDTPSDTDEILSTARAIGDRLDGVLFNGITDATVDELADDVVPFLESEGIPVHGILPRDRSLAGVTVADLARSLGADILTGDANTDVHVERFSVGAMSGSSALERFRRTRDAVVVTGGDRSEVQTAALEASGIKALLLTGGFQPASAVIGQAADRNIPVLSVQSDTRTTIDRVEEVLRTGQTRNEATVERMRTLLDDGVDVESLLSIDL
ncbi:phosphotransacetylase family protein [Haloarcula brevis]|uniref:phosphotransacetylase family protein n=1 Tax=Haloarcula brevis TaxID=3111453 RepID=UPI00300ECCAB